MPKVDYSRDTYNMCLCGGCPVNRSSTCVGKQEKALKPLVEQIEMRNVLPDEKAMPGIYCAKGKSACDDINGGKSCLCPACSVFINEALDDTHYCLKGRAEDTGK